MTPGSITPAPLLQAMANYADAGRLGFHMPGHQQGKAFLPFFRRLLAGYGAAFDLTELPDLDNLAAPAGCIEESQAAMARLYGSKSAYYLINGASAGLEAAMLAFSGPGVPTIMPAHCHAAICNGLILSGSRPFILPSLVDPVWGLPLGLDRRAALAWLAPGEVGACPDDSLRACAAKCLWISINPGYHGLLADPAWDKSILDTYPGWNWVADEAHGAHLPFVDIENAAAGFRAGRQYSALSHGAHAVIHSIHKMGTGFTQTGVLHCTMHQPDDRLRQALTILQSSSPSYLLMASLDAWQAFLHDNGAVLLQETQSLALELAERIRACGDYRLWQDELPAGYATDPRKITLSPAELGMNGVELAQALRRDFCIDVELAAQSHILLIVNPGHQESDICRMANALRAIRNASPRRNAAVQPHAFAANRISGKLPGEGPDPRKAPTESFRPGQKPRQTALSPREAFFRPRERIRLDEAASRIAADAVTPYPPGIPLLFPGMEIDSGTLASVLAIRQAALPCAGLTRVNGRDYIDVVADA